MPRRFPDDPRPWTVLETSYLARKEWFTVRQERVRTSTGREIAEFWVSEYRPWVNVVAVTQDERLVLIRQYRHGIADVHYELPAGTTDDRDASPLQAAQRELLEETGYAGGRWRPLASLCANPALQNNLTHTFVAEGVELVGPATLDGYEEITVHLIAIDEVEALMRSGDMVQALNVAALGLYLLERRR